MIIKKKLAIRLLCACFAGMLLFGSFRYYAYADTAEIEESIKQKQKEIEEAQKKKKELQSAPYHHLNHSRFHLCRRKTDLLAKIAIVK